MVNYRPTIGLEIHAELKTKSKMFCFCKNDSGERHPNINICPVCLGHPGTLPVINKDAILKTIKTGLALGAKIPEFSKFDRKNYFYPDLPKGYQISQYDAPLCLGGYLEILIVNDSSEPKNPKSEILNPKQIQNSKFQNSRLKKIRIRRIHLEEDAGKLIHEAGIKNYESDNKNHNSKFKIHNSSLVDFNRAGVPLMELVTEPDIESAEEAKSFAQELQKIFQYLDISEANMEKGEMRCEANISLMSTNTDSRIFANEISENSRALGTKVEVKNLNSFQSLERAIDYEIKRQSEILSRGEKIIQETRGFDEEKGITFSQRTKEEAQDYRYFPEPDLPSLDLKAFDIEKLKLEIPELPAQKRLRFKKEFSLKDSDIEIIIADRFLAKYFEEAVSEFLEIDKENIKAIQFLANYLNNDLLNLIREMAVDIREIKLTPENFAELIDLVSKNKVSSRVAKDLLGEIARTGGDPSQMIEERGLLQVSDESQIQEAVKKIISQNEKMAADYKAGKVKIIEALIGLVMKETKGKANPKVIKEVILKELR